MLLDVILLDLQPSQGELGPRRRQEKAPGPELLGAVRLLERERNLHQRLSAGIALNQQPLDQQRERIVLVLQGVEHGGSDTPQERAKGRVARQIGAEGQHVDEVADHVLESGSAPAGEWATDQEILLAGVAAELHLEGGQRHREERGPLTCRQRFQSAHQLGCQPPGDGPAAPREYERPRLVERQVEHKRRTRELPRPVVPEPFALRAGEQLGLPVDEVAIVLGRSRERRQPAVALGRIKRLHFFNEQDQRPEIADDVVHTHEQNVIVHGTPEQLHAQ